MKKKTEACKIVFRVVMLVVRGRKICVYRFGCPSVPNYVSPTKPEHKLCGLTIETSRIVPTSRVLEQLLLSVPCPASNVSHSTASQFIHLPLSLALPFCSL